MPLKIVFLFSLVVSLFVTMGSAQAQELLTLEEAVKIALEKNYDIKLVANDLIIDKNNVNRANAGMLPVIDATLTNNNNLHSNRLN